MSTRYLIGRILERTWVYREEEQPRGKYFAIPRIDTYETGIDMIDMRALMAPVKGDHILVARQAADDSYYQKEGKSEYMKCEPVGDSWNTEPRGALTWVYEALLDTLKWAWGVISYLLTKSLHMLVGIWIVDCATLLAGLVFVYSFLTSGTVVAVIRTVAVTIIISLM